MKITESKDVVKVNQILPIMQAHFGNSMNLARIKLMAFMLHTLCVVQTVSLHKLAAAMPTSVERESNLRRIQRFIAKYALNLDLVARMIFSLLPVKTGLVLSMDRTNWKFGDFDINVLMLGVTYKGIAFPLMFSLLPKKGGQRKILRGISDKILSLCETNESSAIMETNGYRLLLPEGTLDYFNISDVKESSSEIVIYLEEKNELPGEYSTVKVESKGFYDPVVVRDFPIRGKNLFLNIRRRRWILKDEGRYVSRNWKLVAEGSRMTHEFASFLKELY